MSLRRAMSEMKRVGEGKVGLGMVEKEGEERRGEKEDKEEAVEEGEVRCWLRMLPEIMREIIRRVEESEDQWPDRKSVVACACVCRSWRDIAREMVKSPIDCGIITFPSSLKEPGPRDLPLQCLIKRNKKDSMFYLYLGVNPASVERGKFLLAARRFRHGPFIEYIISLDRNELSQRSATFMGKLCSNFLGTKYTIYDSKPPYESAKPSKHRMSQRFGSRQICPQAAGGLFEIGDIAYKFNLLKSKGPRRMECSLQCPSIGNSDSSSKEQNPKVPPKRMALKNKFPRWHEHLQCWCLNFHGRVTIASVKNFQLAASVDPIQRGDEGNEEPVLLQFGKVGNDLFTMDYREPLSAFQAFALCLSSFGTKIACE